MALDDRFAALRERVGADADVRPVDVVDGLAGTRARRARRLRRHRVVTGVAASVVVALGVAGIAWAVSDGTGDQGLTTGPSSPGETPGPGPVTDPDAPPPVDPSRTHLWLSATDVPTAGADLAVVIVAGVDQRSETFGVAARVERWTGSQWTRVGSTGVCMDFWQCLGEIGAEDAVVQDIGLGVDPGGVGPLTWLHVDGLEPGHYRLRTESNEGTVATGQFVVRDDAPAPPPADQLPNDHLAVAPTVRLATMSSTLVSVEPVAPDHPVPDGWWEGRARLERWDGERWVSDCGGSVALPAPEPSPATGTEASRVDTSSCEPGAHRLVVEQADGPALDGRFWIEGDAGG